jgi:hypothetical protein
MLRKFSLVAVAAASLGVAALAPTSASAWGAWHGGWHHGWGFGGPRIYVGGPAFYGYGYGYGGCYVRRLVPTPWGPRWRLINRCYCSALPKSPGCVGRGFCVGCSGNPSAVQQNLTKVRTIVSSPETIFAALTWFAVTSLKRRTAGHGRWNRRRQRTD